MVVLIVVLMAYLTVKDEMSMVLSINYDFYAPYVDVHHDLIRPLSILYVGGCQDHGGVGEVVGILHVYYIGGYISQTVICCFLPVSWSKVLSY